MTRHITLRALLSVAFLLVAACSHTPQAPEPIPNTEGNAAISAWQLSGKLGLRSEGKAHSGYLNWQQCGDDYRIRVSGPLGQGAASLAGNSFRATLRSRNSEVTASNPEQLLQQQLGWSIPVAQLQYWIRGIPAPNQNYRLIEEQLQQAGWLLSYRRWQQVDQYQLPAKMTATHPRAKVTLIIKDWQLDTDCKPSTASIDTNR